MLSMNSFPGIWPPTNTVQTVSKFFIDLGESGQQLYYGIHAFTFFALLFLSVYSWWVEKAESTMVKHSRIREILLSDWIFLIVVIAFILMARIPLASTGILNPDEPYWVAEAKALWKDPRPWVSVDTGTGGPLVPLILISLKIFGLPIDQGSIKLLGGLMVALSTVCVYLGLSIVKQSALLRLLILPLVIAFSVMRSGGDLTAYNSEHPAILVLCIAFVLFCKLYSGSGINLLNLFFLGFFLGLVPFVKLQGIPIAFFLGITSCFIAIKRFSMGHVFVLIIGALAPMVLTLLALWAYGGLNDFWTGYIQYNISYTSKTVIQGNGLMPRITLFFDLAFRAQDLHFFLYVSLAILSVGIASLFLRNKIAKSEIAEILFSFVLVGVSIFSITAPGRPFLHYLLFLPIPLTILSAVIFVIALKDSQNSSTPQPSRAIKLLISLGFIICMSLFYFKGINFTKTDFQGRAREHYNGFAPQGLVGAVLDHYFTSDTRIAVWEYEPELFEGTDFLPGTRDVATDFPLQGKLSDYYVDRYLKDLNTNKPSLFLESTSRIVYGTDQFPKIHEYMKKNYVQDAVVDGNKIYVRNDELTKDRGWIVKKDLDVKFVSEFHSDLQALTQNGSFLYFRGWTVFGENVTDQRVFLILKSEQDTLFIPSHQLSNSVVAEFSGKQNYLMCGFLGFIPVAKIPKGNYNVWLQVENNNETGLKQINRTLNTDSLLMK